MSGGTYSLMMAPKDGLTNFLWWFYLLLDFWLTTFRILLQVSFFSNFSNIPFFLSKIQRTMKRNYYWELVVYYKGLGWGWGWKLRLLFKLINLVSPWLGWFWFLLSSTRKAIILTSIKEWEELLNRSQFYRSNF